MGGWTREGWVAGRREDLKFRILWRIERYGSRSQRRMAEDLCVPFSAVNDCLNALVGGGYLEIVDFRASRNRRGYTYALTPRGLAYRHERAASFIERRWQDYEAISQELQQLLYEFGDAVPPGRLQTVVPAPMHRFSMDRKPERAVLKASVD